MTFKLLKPDFKYIGQIVMTWSFLNVSFNIFGLWFNKIISKSNFEYLGNILNEFAKPLIFQSIIFALCLVIGYILFENKKIANYIFVAFQFLVFNLIFLFNLKIHHGIHFVTSWDSAGLLYFSLNGQYLIDLLYLKIPLAGQFDGNIFAPANAYIFYFDWIILTTVYFSLLTMLTFPVLKFMNKK